MPFHFYYAYYSIYKPYFMLLLYLQRPCLVQVLYVPWFTIYKYKHNLKTIAQWLASRRDGRGICSNQKFTMDYFDYYNCISNKNNIRSSNNRVIKTCFFLNYVITSRIINTKCFVSTILKSFMETWKENVNLKLFETIFNFKVHFLIHISMKIY